MTAAYLSILLSALSQIESNDNDAAVGKAGEISRWQMMPEVWDNATHKPRAMARIYKEALPVARKELESRIGYFRYNLNRDPVPEQVYALWNIGAICFKNMHFDDSLLSWRLQATCERFANLVRKLEREQKAK